MRKSASSGVGLPVLPFRPTDQLDIVNVDFYNPDREGLWTELRDTVLFWCDQGVKTFREEANSSEKPAASTATAADKPKTN